MIYPMKYENKEENEDVIFTFTYSPYIIKFEEEMQKLIKDRIDAFIKIEKIKRFKLLLKIGISRIAYQGNVKWKLLSELN